MVERARIVLLAAEGKQHKEIAEQLGISVQKAARWRERFLKLGVADWKKTRRGQAARPASPPKPSRASCA